MSGSACPVGAFYSIRTTWPLVFDMVLTGCLGLVVEAVSHDEPAVMVQAGEIVGEYALLLNRPQASTCVAIRDSSLVWLSKQSFDALVRKHPEALLAFTTQLTELFGRALSFHRRIFTVPKTLALIPLHEGAPVAQLAAALVAAVGDAGQKATVVDSDAATLRADVFQAFELSTISSSIAATRSISEWTKTCIRQADRVQLVANTTDFPFRHENLLEAIKTLPWRQAELVCFRGRHALARAGRAVAPPIPLDLPLPHQDAKRSQIAGWRATSQAAHWRSCCQAAARGASRISAS